MQSDWQVDFFRGVALECWRRVTNPEQTRTEVDFIERALQVCPGAQLLDVPCGNGRHAVEFSKRSYAVTGVDLSEEAIAEARAQIAVGTRWIAGDMRELTWASEFEGAYSFGNSFGFLDRNNCQNLSTYRIRKFHRMGSR